MKTEERPKTESGKDASIELSDSSGPLIRVIPESAHASFLCDFAQRCFFTGTFMTKGRKQNTWILDCRVGLGHGGDAQTLARVLVHRAKERGISQFAGTGFGAYFLLGAILGVEKQARVGLMRSNTKSFGRRNLIEGDLDANQPVCVVDDVINSGRTACRAVDVLRQQGFDVNHCLCLFSFNWGGGIKNLSKKGVDCSWLATVSRSGGFQPRTSASKSRSLFSRLCRSLSKFFAGAQELPIVENEYANR